MHFNLLHSVAIIPGVRVSTPASRFDGAAMEYVIDDIALLETSPIPKSLSHKIDRVSALAIKAIDRLLPHVPSEVPSDRIGLFIGNVYAGWSYGETQLLNLVEIGASAVHPFQATAWFPAAAQGELTILNQWKGISKTYSGHRCAFAEALLGAAMSLQAKKIDAAVVGVAESNVSDFLSWGAERRIANAIAAEGALFIAIERTEDVGEKSLRAHVVEKDTTGIDSLCSEGPVGWISLLSKEIANVLSPSSSGFMLPLSDHVGLLIERTLEYDK